MLRHRRRGREGLHRRVLEKIATRVPAPILVDRTEADVIEEALKRIPGKAIINSINLEDGEKRTSRVLPMAKRYGAAVIALTIDEEGMALDRRPQGCHRPSHLRTGDEEVRHASRGLDLRRADAAHFDRPGRIPLGRHRDAGGGRRIKQELPEVKTMLGVSNISFGLNAYARRVLNSVFLHEAVDRGLDMAIVNYTKIYPLYKIPEAEVELARKLIFQDRSAGDPLQLTWRTSPACKGQSEMRTSAQVESLSIEDKLKHCIIRGERTIGDGRAQANAGSSCWRRRLQLTRRST